MIEGGDRYIEPFTTAVVFKKKRRAAAAGERTNPIRVIDLPQFAEKNFDLIARNRTPGHERCTARAPAIDAMAVAQLPRLVVQAVAHVAAKTAAVDLRFHPRKETCIWTIRQMHLL